MTRQLHVFGIDEDINYIFFRRSNKNLKLRPRDHDRDLGRGQFQGIHKTISTASPSQKDQAQQPVDSSTEGALTETHSHRIRPQTGTTTHRGT